MDATVSKNNKIFTETPKAIYDTMNDAISYPKIISHFSEELPADIRAIYKQNGLELSERYINGRRIVQFSITPQTSMNDAQLIR